jgi:hypothetical protein
MSRLSHAKCLLATGREPRRLLRDLRDAEALRAPLVPGAHSALSSFYHLFIISGGTRDPA